MAFQRAAVVMLAGSALAAGGCQTYHAEVTTLQAVPNMDVEISRVQGPWWKVTAENHAPDAAKLIWNDSAYVATTGRADRLVRGRTRWSNTDRSQPDSPIPPGARLEEEFISEVFVSGSGGRNRPGDPERDARIVLVFEIDGQPHTHESAVHYTRD